MMLPPNRLITPWRPVFAPRSTGPGRVFYIYA